MHSSMIRLALVAALVVAPVIAFAQPSDTPPVGDGSGSGSATPTPTGIDEGHLKELVDREVARILNERAAAEAAERAAKDQAADKTVAPGTPDDGTLTGANGFMDTRLAFTLTNENVLVKPGETIPSVPGWRFGTPNSLGVLFFDNYDTRYSGFETLSHATMYRDYHKGHFEAEAGLVIKINELSGSNLSLADDGSYITLSNWKDPLHRDPTRISLTVFPVSADRFRLGYSYRLSWGGNPEYGNATSATPGAKVQYDTDNMYVFAGAKSAVILDQRTAEQKSALAALAGAGIDPTDFLRLEVNGGYFDRGYNELIDVNDQKVQLFGGSFQASIHKGMPLRSSVDYRLYRYNGEKVSDLFLPDKYPGGLSWLAQSEVEVIGQTLKDPSETGVTKIQTGHAADLNVRVKYNRTRLRLDVSFRDLAYILHSVPSLPTYEDFPSDYKTTPDIFAAVGADQNYGDFLTVGIIAGIEQPSSLTAPTGIPGSMGGGTGKTTAVFVNNNVDTLITILPQNASVVPQFALKGTAKLDFGRIYSALVEVFYMHNPNATTYQRVGCTADQACPQQPFEFTFANQNQLGVNATLQARF